MKIRPKWDLFMVGNNKNDDLKYIFRSFGDRDGKEIFLSRAMFYSYIYTLQ